MASQRCRCSSVARTAGSASAKCQRAAYPALNTFLPSFVCQAASTLGTSASHQRQVDKEPTQSQTRADANVNRDRTAAEP